MDEDEVLQRVIGVLTQAREWATDAAADQGDTVALELLQEVLPPISVPADASAEDLGPLMTAQLGPPLRYMISAFTGAFVQLALVHDAGQPEVSSADVLRDLALRAAAGWPDDEV